VNAVAAIVLAVSLLAVLLALRLTRPRGDDRMVIGSVA
jgi:hypothetical protein